MTKDVECRVVTSDAMVVAALPYEGPASGVGEAFAELVEWADTHQVEQWGPLVGVYEDGEADSAIRAEVWFPISPDRTGLEFQDPRVEVRSVPGRPVATAVHRGYPDELGEVLGALAEWIMEQGLERAEPVHRQLYHAAPPGRPADWVVEIQFPVLDQEGG